ncbi:MAG: hypothetical protein R6X23_09430 [Acidimicrobiia bacterium]
MHARTRVVLATLAALALVGTSTATADVAAKKKSTALVGVFEIDAVDCATAEVSGSYFRMIQAGGTAEAGPFLPNGDSTCTDQSYTGLTAGTDGGLRTGEYQPQPDPPFDGAGNGLADAIFEPATFFALKFAVSTNEADPQSGTAVPAPKITASKKGALSGQLKAISVAYGGQEFNQGTPKPDGTIEGGTSALTGTTTRSRAPTPSNGRARSREARSTASPVCGTSRAPSRRRSRTHAFRRQQPPLTRGC